MKGKALRILLPAAGLAMILFGLLRGEQLAIWAKAITVCLECVGIG
ncbi:MAG: thioredoxin [Syntrophomonadaceae bacterium]|nr:thioredoxin [Syntrophomonadaceae bacterium]